MNWHCPWQWLRLMSLILLWIETLSFDVNKWLGSKAKIKPKTKWTSVIPMTVQSSFANMKKSFPKWETREPQHKMYISLIPFIHFICLANGKLVVHAAYCSPLRYSRASSHTLLLKPVTLSRTYLFRVTSCFVPFLLCYCENSLGFIWAVTAAGFKQNSEGFLNLNRIWCKQRINQ